MTEIITRAGVYGAPDPALADVPADARQCSPLVPGSAAIEDCPDASLDAFVIAAPAGTLERRYVIAHALRALKPDGVLTIMAGKKKGGLRLGDELEAMGCAPSMTSKSHQKIATTPPPSNTSDLHAVIAETGPRLDEDMGLWTQPGVFSWNRPDPGSVLLMDKLPEIAGRGADLGCGLGLLAHRVLENESVTELILTDIDRRAIEMAWRNVGDDRIKVLWHDARLPSPQLTDLDFVVMNPPFHLAGEEDHGLGKAFIKAAAKMLRKGGKCWLVANRHLPYEADISTHFARHTVLADEQGFKIIEALK